MARIGVRLRGAIVAATGMAILVACTAVGCDAGPEPTGSGAPVAVPPEGLLIGGPNQIHGAWSPLPFALPQALVARMDAVCRESLTPFPPNVQVVVVDARGRSVAQLYYAGPNGASASCQDVTVRPSGEVEALGGGSVGFGNNLPPMGPFDLMITDQAGRGRPAEATYLAGRAGGGIASVVLVNGGGLVVAKATLRPGWFALWILGGLPPGAVLQGRDASGRSVGTAPNL